MRSATSGLTDSIWKFLSSLKLTIFLLICLASVSIIGTLIPQGAPPPVEYLQTLSRAKFIVYDRLGFFDMYHSWWFISLLGILCLNLIACSLRRLPHDWKSITSPPRVLDETLEKSLPLTARWKAGTDAAGTERKITALLEQEFARPEVSRIGHEVHLFARKGAIGRIGVYVLHSSIIIILVGAIIGSLAGYKAFVEIPEGGSATTVVAGPEGMKRKAVDLGFTVRCDSFSVSYYDTGAPREYKSILSIVDGGRTVVDKRPVLVNRPLSYKGVTFYQQSYGQAAPPTFHLGVRERKTGKSYTFAVSQGGRVTLPNGDTLHPVESVPEIRPYISQVSGPAVRVVIIPKAGEPLSLLLLQRYPDFDAQRGGDLVFTIDSIDQKWKTGLQVVKDPGVWIVWLGCSLMVAGIFVAFFLSHRRIWVRIADGRVTMAGNAGKNMASFKDFFDGMADKMRKA